MLPRLFKGVYHFTVYAIGILVLTAAVVVTLIRLFLPDIGSYRGEVEAWVGNYMEYPVVMHSLDASWEGWVPLLHLKDIELMNKAGTQAITHFDSAQIKIAPLATLIKRRVVPKQLTIKGFELAIARLSNGAIYIEGINVSDNQVSQTDNNELAEWLFKQDQIKIEDARIEWIDIKHQQKPILLSDVNFILRSDGERLQAEGSAMLPELYGKKMDFSFDAQGDLLSSEWSGELYLAGRDINPDQWYKAYRPLNFVVSGGSANIEVWSTWQEAKLSSLEGELLYNDFETQVGDSKLHIEELAYRFLGKRLGNDGWQFHLNLNQLLTDNGNWPETNIMLSATRANNSENYKYSSTFNYLKLDDLSPFIRNLAFLPDPIKEKLVDLSLQGELSEGKLIYDPDLEPSQRLRFDTRFSEMDAEFGADMPSLSNLSGHLYGFLDKGEVSLDSDATRINSELLEKKSLQLEKLKGRVSWHKNLNDWQLNTDLLQIQTSDLSARLRGKVTKTVNHDSPFIDMSMSLDETELATISDYIPSTKTFKLKDWMKRSVLGGKLSSTKAIFRGHLSEFPFDHDNGRFKLIADTSNATLDYSNFWPPIDNIDAEIIIDGREMLANFRHGEIFSAAITEGKATIPNLMTKKKTVILDGHIRGATKDLSLFINQSPLGKDKGLKEISNSLVNGDIGIDLELNIPIKQPGKTVSLNGNIALSNSTLKAPVKELKLDNVNGNIAFTRTSVSSETLSASFVEKPVSLVLSGSKLEPDNLPSLKIKGVLDSDFVADRLIENFPALLSLEHYLRDRMQGDAEWNITLSNLPADGTGKVVKKLEAQSWLNGLHVDYPAPIGKASYRPRPLTITTLLEKDQPQTVNVKYAEILNAELLLDANKKLHTINMHFGNEQMPSNELPGLHISGAVDKLVATEWWEVIKPRATDKKKSTEGIIQTGVSVGLQVLSLDLFKQDFSNVALTLQRPEDSWNFNLSADDINGNIQIPVDLTNDNLISFQMDKLELKPRQGYIEEETDVAKIQASEIPSIRGSAKEFIFNGMNLGEMNLSTMPGANGLTVEELAFKKEAMEIVGRGNWLSHSEQESSSFEIDLLADNMETMLTTFGYNETPVKKGTTELHLIAEWDGSPMDFSLEHMNGTLGMQIKKGQLLDVKPSAGRLFGIFSLQTLARRLTLDFTDIFGKGLAFDKIEGSFELDNGNAYTSDLSMRGPSANVSISGRTGLSEQDYDQIVTVTPQLSDNLPVAGVLLGPVGIGLGAVFYLAGQMFDSVHNSIDKLLSYQYTITGSWTEPVIEKIKNTKKDAQLSEASG
jgi:uncharacterized protein (TIGR02099 family)